MKTSGLNCLSNIKYIPALFLLLVPASYAAADSITTYEASRYTGTVKKVCGYCVGGLTEKREKGSPTYLYFEYMHQRAVFMAKIWEYDLKKFSSLPQQLYGEKALCVTGRIEEDSYGRTFITVTEPGQIEEMKPYEVQSEEQYELEQSAAYHKRMFRPKERVAVKILLKSLGYTIDDPDDSWGMDCHRAVKAFEKDNSLEPDAKLTRKDFFAMEKAVSSSKSLSYSEKRRLFDSIQKLLKRAI